MLSLLLSSPLLYLSAEQEKHGRTGKLWWWFGWLGCLAWPCLLYDRVSNQGEKVSAIERSSPPTGSSGIFSLQRVKKSREVLWVLARSLTLCMCTTFRPAAVNPPWWNSSELSGELQWGCNRFGGGRNRIQDTERESGGNDAGKKRSKRTEHKVELKKILQQQTGKMKNWVGKVREMEVGR